MRRARKRVVGCTRQARAGVITRRNRPKGRTSTTFTGRMGRKALALGSYRATIVAADRAANRSRSRTVTFTIVRATPLKRS